jgi:rhodanese-related sulfurtransferase
MVHYCKSGWRAALAGPILHLLDNDNTRGLAGSYLAWVDRGFPVESGSDPPFVPRENKRRSRS